MTKRRKILTFCATQVSMIALALGFGGNQQAQGPYAKLFNNAFGVKDAEAQVAWDEIQCGVCMEEEWVYTNEKGEELNGYASWCSDAQAAPGDWCEYDVVTGHCTGGGGEEACGYDEYGDGGEHDDDDES